MIRRSLLQFSALVALSSISLHSKSSDWQSGELAAIDVVRTPVGKKLIYRYSYSVHANGFTYTFDDPKKLPLTVNGPVRFVVNGDKLRVLDERGKEHKETVLKKAVDK
jgi:hypothetical protein